MKMENKKFGLIIENYYCKFIEMIKDPLIDQQNIIAEFFQLKIQFYNYKEYREKNFLLVLDRTEAKLDFLDVSKPFQTL